VNQATRLAIAAVALKTLVACSDPFAEAKKAVRHDMKDPASTEFRDVRWCGATGGPIMGEFNSKNSYGALAGFKRFYYADQAAATDENDYSYERLFKLCMKESARQLAKVSGKAFNEQAEDDRLNAVFVPDDLSAPAVRAPLPTPTPEPARDAAAARDDEMLNVDEVSVCDRPDSPEKAALMNEIGTDCMGE